METFNGLPIERELDFDINIELEFKLDSDVDSDADSIKAVEVDLPGIVCQNSKTKYVHPKPVVIIDIPKRKISFEQRRNNIQLKSYVVFLSILTIFYLAIVGSSSLSVIWLVGNYPINKLYIAMILGFSIIFLILVWVVITSYCDEILVYIDRKFTSDEIFA